MELGDPKLQKSRKRRLPWEGAGEAGADPRSEAGSPVDDDTERSGTRQLMEAALSRGNLRLALKRVRRNKGGPGIDGMTVDELPEHLKAHWPEIREELLADRYKPRPVRRQSIPKDGGGMRELGIPTVLDRFIQQALLQVLQPRFDPTFSDHSYGFRPGRGAHGAVQRARGYIQEGRRVVVDIDLEKFFDRVNHDVLMGRLSRRIEDKRVLRLIRRYLNAGVVAEGVVMERHEGTPQGGPLSPLLANVLLDEVDKELEKRGHAFVRYADDCNVYVRSERAGVRVMEQLKKLLAQLRLRVNESKSAVAPAVSRAFLGYGFWVAPGGEIRLRAAGKSKKRLKERVRQLTRRSRGRSQRQMIGDLSEYLRGWKEYFRLAATPGVLRDLDGWIRHRLRAVQLKHWRRGTTAFRELRKLGLTVDAAAQIAANTRRWWHNASKLLHTALPNRYFDEQGLPRLAG